MKEALIIFMVLLILLMIISIFGGSLRFSSSPQQQQQHPMFPGTRYEPFSQQKHQQRDLFTDAEDPEHATKVGPATEGYYQDDEHAGSVEGYADAPDKSKAKATANKVISSIVSSGGVSAGKSIEPFQSGGEFAAFGGVHQA